MPRLAKGLQRYPQPRLRGHRERAAPGIERSEAQRSAVDDDAAAEHVEADNDAAADDLVKADNDAAADNLGTVEFAAGAQYDTADKLRVERSGAQPLGAVPRGVPHLASGLHACP